MSEILSIPKFTLVITTRCNLKCKMCCEYVPQNKPFPDMTLGEERAILRSLFNTVDHVGILHLSGGGEPFLHPKLAEMVDIAFEYADKFDRFMLFTNTTVPINDKLFDTIKRYSEKTVIHASDYGVVPERTLQIQERLRKTDAVVRVVKYYGDEQDFGGWVDFGHWEPYNRTEAELKNIFSNCAVTRDMKGNWRTRDGKAHWCSRSQRGMELGLVPDNPDNYVDLLDASESREEKRRKFQRIANADFLIACDRCSGEQGTYDDDKRHKAAEQEV